MTSGRGSEVRARRDALVADRSLRGPAFGAGLAAVVDDALRAALDDGPADVAVLALGSYARNELCPGSDVDVLLLTPHGRDVSELADALWYPLWDAGLVLGHAARSAKESLKLAERDLDTLTSLLEGRAVAGDADAVDRLVADARVLAHKRRATVIPGLADAATLRRHHPGPVAEMLDPNLKDGAGGLRDLQSLVWAGWCLGEPGGLAALVDADLLAAGDAERLADARDRLLTVRVELHRVTGGRSDVLALQEQDAVASALGAGDADFLLRDLARCARDVAWITDEVFGRLRASTASPRRRGGTAPVEPLGPGVVRRGGRVELADGTAADAALLVRLARIAAETRLPIGRGTLVALRDVEAPVWTPDARADLVALLRAGEGAIDAFAALDHEDLVARILPEWENVRSRPQRNAYHRFTVDRHLVETVAEAARLLDDPDAPGAHPAAELARPELLLLGALLHDIAKGRPGDHAVVGAAMAELVGARLGLDAAGVDALAWLVRRHLLMADTATRRDLADPITVARFAARVGDPQRLRLLTLLTAADSRATGPAAWGAGKAALVQELYDRTLAYWSGSAAGGGVHTVDVAVLAGPGVVVDWTELGDDRLRCSVGADDRPGLLAGVAGALALEGFHIDAAEGHSLPGGRAAEVFEGTDSFGRLADPSRRERAAATITGVLDGRISVAEALRERRAAYGHRRDPAATANRVDVRVDPEEAVDASVVEVYAPDEIGLLATVAGVFASLNLDVTVAKVATTGELAVDVFYVRDRGAKLADAARIAELGTALRTALTAD